VQLSLFSFQPRTEKPSGDRIERQIRSVLEPRLPVNTIDVAVLQILKIPVNISVVRGRTSKSGDFRAPHNGSPARITVNGTLNPYAFLVTLVHELAHHYVHHAYAKAVSPLSLRRKRRPLPHGKEWKAQFGALMSPYLDPLVFPADLLPVLTSYTENPRASTSADHHLSKALKKYDPPDMTRRLEEIPFDAVFTLHGKRFFRKKEKIRTRYRCICLNTNRIYLVSREAPVICLDETQSL